MNPTVEVTVTRESTQHAMPSPRERDDTHGRAELARWLDWGEVPWVVIEQMKVDVRQVCGGDYAKH